MKFWYYPPICAFAFKIVYFLCWFIVKIVYKNCVCTSQINHTCHMSSTYWPWFIHANSVSWRLYITKLLLYNLLHHLLLPHLQIQILSSALFSQARCLPFHFVGPCLILFRLKNVLRSSVKELFYLKCLWLRALKLRTFALLIWKHKTCVTWETKAVTFWVKQL